MKPPSLHAFAAAPALALVFSALHFTSSSALAGDKSLLDPKETASPKLNEPWKFSLASPGWMAGVEGTVGLNGVNSNVDVGFNDLVNKIDMAFAMRAEASKGRFGIMGELIYLSLSDGIGAGGVLQKVDVRLDEYLADFTLRYRVIEGPRGFVDALAGVRYTNIYQSVHLQADDEGIGEFSEKFVDDVSARLRERLDETLSEGRFRNALQAAVVDRVSDKLAGATGPNPSQRSLPNAALAHRSSTRLGRHIERLVHRAERELVARTLSTAREAAAAERQAALAATAELRASAQKRAAALRATVNQRIAETQKNLERKIEDTLHKNLNRSFALTEAWWDPYLGLRARYNFTPAIYILGRGDIGGFGVGSDLMWQAEGALGFQVTRSIFAELGYRALSFDYDHDGYASDTITHGAQVTVGIIF